jgi:hypothetical protein
MEPSGRNQWQPVANGKGPKNGRNKPKPLLWVATGCRSERMVRRGSTVRVRQRALQKRRTSALFCSGRVARHRTCGRYGAVYGAFSCKKSDLDLDWPQALALWATRCQFRLDQLAVPPEGL